MYTLLKYCRVSNELGAGRLGNSSGIDHSVGVVLELVAGDEVIKDDVWANVYHSSATPELPTRLHSMMDSAMHLFNVEEANKFKLNKENGIIKSKLTRIIFQDEDV